MYVILTALYEHENRKGEDRDGQSCWRRKEVGAKLFDVEILRRSLVKTPSFGPFDAVHSVFAGAYLHRSLIGTSLTIFDVFRFRIQCFARFVDKPSRWVSQSQQSCLGRREKGFFNSDDHVWMV